MGSMVNFQMHFLAKALKEFLSGPWGPKIYGFHGIHGPMESMGPMGPMGPGPMGTIGPMGPGPMGPGPGPGPLGIGGRSQQKHVLGKSDVSHAEKWCRIGIFEGIRDQGVHKQASDVHIPNGAEGKYQLG